MIEISLLRKSYKDHAAHRHDHEHGKYPGSKDLDRLIVGLLMIIRRLLPIVAVMCRMYS